MALLLEESGMRGLLGLDRRNEWRPRSANWILGAALAIRCQAFEVVGGFDGTYFLYHEEVDLCHRFWEAGWEIHYAPVATVRHVGGASTSQRAVGAYGQYIRSAQRFARLRLSRMETAGVRAVLAAVLVGRLGREVAQLAWARDPDRRRRLRGQTGVWLRGLAAGVGIRNNRWKDFTTLREAVARTAALLGRPVLLVALGDDAPSERLGNAEIRFIPFQPRPETVARYYQAADIYVHATRADTFPNGVLEALACGVPVVASAIGGIPEQLDDGGTGFLVPPGDASALSMRVAQMLGQPGLRREMSSQAAAAARSRFDLERQVDAYLGWYRELAEQVRPPAPRR
jgi:hypothetical protein